MLQIVYHWRIRGLLPVMACMGVGGGVEEGGGRSAPKVYEVFASGI